MADSVPKQYKVGLLRESDGGGDAHFGVPVRPKNPEDGRYAKGAYYV